MRSELGRTVGSGAQLVVIGGTFLDQRAVEELGGTRRDAPSMEDLSALAERGALVVSGTSFSRELVAMMERLRDREASARFIDEEELVATSLAGSSRPPGAPPMASCTEWS